MVHWLLILALSIVAFLFVVFCLLFLSYIGGPGGVGWDLYPSIIRSRRAIRGILKNRGYSFRVESFGATSIDPRHLCVCINVNRDAERDLLQEDHELIDQFRQALLESGYPAESVQHVGFSFESQETVDRDFGGNWYYARK
jgi:hypothetical protein